MAEAKVSCGKDWKRFLKHDSKSTLFYLDPPWEATEKYKGYLRYKSTRPIPFDDFVSRARKLRGSVAISYKDAPEFRKELCKRPFKCHKVNKQIMGHKFTQLLAIKKSK